MKDKSERVFAILIYISFVLSLLVVLDICILYHPNKDNNATVSSASTEEVSSTAIASTTNNTTTDDGKIKTGLYTNSIKDGINIIIGDSHIQIDDNKGNRITDTYTVESYTVSSGTYVLDHYDIA